VILDHGPATSGLRTGGTGCPQSLQYRLSVRSLVLATGCVLRSCGTMGVVRPTVLIVDDHEVFRVS
jgi:hypothetical protein